MKKLFILSSSLLCLSCSTIGFANDDVTSESDLFTPQQIQQWESEALDRLEEAPIVSDKEENGATISGINGKKFGTWSWRDGVICITDSYAKSPLFNNGHAGIVAAAPYYDSVIEANPADGVQPKYGSWESAARFSGNTIVQVGVKSTTVAQDRKAAQWAAKQIGKPYNRSFTNINTRSSFYCSQLVWAAYKDTTGVDIGTAAWGTAIHPFELINSKTQVIYRNRTS
ncbi:YiiX/YebB-like N1pC/P60 family cysteine hydrolase [Streptococcus gallolyticus]|uniref:YiiX/YebB-like N1pC/P60 family cysteine hydrolase n=1 Tax=Streptococcus gallolyticus TaxID=315405 RepID=UPI002283C682|nr:YiiX/YebB-like N1pC/P60 family cysteine hydrolase [Streptococcus gallolyticus]MCY7166554.1 hypothetical protein [Streptococcus gallolyticus subsp. gallolyticus]MCY7183935.1 hypothetical protein [Streptococcus gallolyticus subsp. gallolyticus]MCY7185862.1 hypothetical protein [Streptococcus gallolyticus subsp. gallolyticus]MCY7188547.1 hypothetical protein [Streptococcus gallolyticus subsp. gallolyticus]